MSRLILAGLAATLFVALPGVLGAAELSLPAEREAAANEAPTNCGPCGCLQVVFDHHRELLMTYGTGFDPRNYDTSEPYYHFGRFRAYPNYLINGVGGTRAC